MPENWKNVKIEDVAEKVGMGPFGSSIKIETFVKEGIPVISGQHLHKSRLQDLEYNFVAEEHANKLKNANVYRGDIIFTHAGNIGQVALIPNTSKYERYILSQRQFYLRCDKEKVLPEYVVYYFKSKLGQNKLLANVSSSGVPSIAKPVTYLRSIEIEIPELPEQRRIAEILSTLDEKIKLNLEMNRTLERIAQATFKHWFVDFQFPGFDGELVDGLPKGWRIGKLGDISINVRKSVNPKDVDSTTPYLGLEHLPQKSIALSNWGKADDAESLKSKFSAGDILFGKIRPYFHKVGVAPIDGICSTDILVIQSKNKEFFGLALVYFSSDDVVKYATMRSNGAKMPRTTWNDLANYEIVIPTENIAEKFSELIHSLTERIKSNIFENRTLIQIRDSLLPRLISGKIRVSG